MIFALPIMTSIQKIHLVWRMISESYRSVIRELSADDLTSGIELSILDYFLSVLKIVKIYTWCNRQLIIPYLDFFVKEHGCNYDILVWIKTNPIPACGRNYLNDKEYCLYFLKSARLHTTYQRGHTYWITPTNK